MYEKLPEERNKLSLLRLIFRCGLRERQLVSLPLE
jgi:hypothetical protein